MDSSKYIRRKFIQFFEKNNHKSHMHSPLAPSSYDTTMFTIAGMKQFTNYFLGKEQPPYENLCTIQPCIRLNDLQNVGKTKRHHTFFEMLGNFSFGGYFKENAIDLAFRFLTEELNIDVNYLYFTVHVTDQESYNIWKTKVPENKILFIDSDDNFWRSGPFGPCGPCTEIYFDTLKANSVDKSIIEKSIINGEDRFLEVWNIVFMEYDQQKDGLKPLKMKCVDTGMGLERITSVYDEVFHNFKTDLFKKIIHEISKENNNFSEAAMVADHMRAIVFLLNENLKPKNEGQGYVLRNLIRRSYLYCKKLSELVPLVVSSLDFYGAFDEKMILTTLEKEVEDFQKILEKAEEIISKTPVIDEEFVFKLYDTYGMPIEISKTMFTDIDWNKVEELKKEHSNKSKKKLYVEFDQFTKQLSFDQHSADAEVLFLGELDELDVYEKDEINQGKFVMISDQSCFYGRGGGQEGDQGIIKNHHFIARVIDTIKQKVTQKNFVLIHICEMEAGSLKKNQKIQMKIDSDLRMARTRAHSATHLFGEYFMRKYGYKIDGSFVDNDYFRIDLVITDGKNLKSLLNDAVEYVNKAIESNIASIVQEEKFEDVQDAIFGDRCNYGEVVRTINFPGFSKQLCGGTHVKNTKDIGKILVIKESAIRSGVRRVEVLTNKRVDQHIQQKKQEQKISIEKPLVILDHIYHSDHNNLEMIITEGGNAGQLLKLAKDNIVVVNYDEEKTKFIFNTKNEDFVRKFVSNFSLKGGGKTIKHYGTSTIIEKNNLISVFFS